MDIHTFTANDEAGVAAGIAAELALHDEVTELRISMVSHGGVIIVVMSYRL